jgi:hypothetical protein
VCVTEEILWLQFSVSKLRSHSLFSFSIVNNAYAVPGVISYRICRDPRPEGTRLSLTRS